MQIRLTVLGPRGGQACDVLVTAPAGTPVGAVAGALAAAAGAGQPSRSAPAVPLYVQGRRLDPDTELGRPPLVEGAVVSLAEPAGYEEPGLADVPRLHVVGGPDAGGVHLLHGGRVRIGRSADADIPLDDPDVSRLHTVVTVEAGRVTVADLGSTNGTALDGRPVGREPVVLAPGALLRIGESTLTLEHPEAGTGPARPANRPVVPDGEGRLRVSPPPAESVPTPEPEPEEPSREGQDGPGSRAMALARRLAPGWVRGESRAAESRRRDRLAAEAAALRARWPDPSELLITALGPGRRLWERDAEHEDALCIRLGTADLPADPSSGPVGEQDGPSLLPCVPVTVDLRRVGSLGVAGPRPRLSGLARSVLAQLGALHAPSVLELVLISADRERPAEERAREWAWLRWLPHLRPAHGQDCRLLLGLDRDQAAARLAELARRVEHGPLGPSWTTASAQAVAAAAARHTGPFTVLVVDGRPDVPGAEEAVSKLLAAGPSAGVHVVCLAESHERLAGACSVVALLDGEVATELKVRYAAEPAPRETTGHITADGVGEAWAERFARALAPLRETEAPRMRSALPDRARLLDILDLALATPAKVSARWTELPATGGSTAAVLGTAADGPCTADLVKEGPHLLVGGAPGSGKTELLRSIAASLSAADRPDRLALVLVDGTSGRGDGLRLCNDLPHVSTYLAAGDPLRLRELAQALTAELDRREELLAGRDFAAWQAERLLSTGRVVSPRRAPGQSTPGTPVPHGPRQETRRPSEQGSVRTRVRTEPALARLVVLVDDFDALVAPALGSPARPAAGSMVRALDAVAMRGARLGVHLVTATGRPEYTSGGEVDRRSRLRIALRTGDAASSRLLVQVDDAAGLDETVPGRGFLRRPDGSVTPFQAGRISGRIPRTATLRPTVVPVHWQRMGDPPTRRPVRELGNGPTDLALLASALQRAAESTGAEPVPPLIG